MLFTKKGLVLCALAASSLGFPAVAQKTSNNAVVTIENNKRDNTPTSITFSAQAGYKSSDAASVFNQYLGLNPAAEEMRFRVSDQAADVNVARYDQYYKGVKVEHGNYVIASKNGVMSYVSGNYYKVPAALNTVAQLSESNALSKALTFTGAQQYIWQTPDADRMLKEELGDPNATYTPHGQLVYVEDFFAGDEPDGKLHLAWKFDIYATEPLSRNDVYVDAATGKILFANATIKHITATGGTLYSGVVTFQAKTNATNYTLHDSTRGSGINTYSLRGGTSTSAANRFEDTSSTTTFATNVAIDAHWGAEKVYDFWLAKHNRLSWNGTNGALNSYVNYGNAYANAMWNGQAMVYGDGSTASGVGPLVSLDITGHEIGHGVCQSTAGLVYNRESGAMNEGFSDIWGACIESYADPHEIDATPKSTWDIGEEIAASPLRSMSNPKLFQNPDTYNGQYWAPASSSCIPSGANDQCGVHNNSSVLNKWFYLLSVGGTGVNDLSNSYAVPGIGIDTAGMVAWGTELSLTSTANYTACRTASINYATTQFGACSRITEAVTRAWYAVGVGSNYSPCTAQISFNGSVTNINEGVGVNDCIATHVEQIPIAINGPVPTGGNAVATITVTGGNAVSGVDYQLNTTTFTFPAGSSAVQYLPVTIYDNGNILDTGRYFDLSISVAANGSTATAANILTQTRVKIINNDAAPYRGTSEIHTVGAGSSSNTVTSPFPNGFNQSRAQYILTASELLAAGVKPNQVFSKLTFVVTIKTSTQPFTDYTVRMGNTTTTSFTNTFLSGLTQVYNGNFSTISGLNNLTLGNNFVWDGTSNIVVEICFTNTSSSASNDVVSGPSGGIGKTAYAGNNSTGGGCSIAFNPSNISDVRPLFRFTQDIAPSVIATTLGDTRIWKVDSNKISYFYNDADTAAIAGISTGGTGLGCVTATVSGAGNGSQLSAFSGVKRSLKEVTLSAIETDTITNTPTIYFTTSELIGMDTTHLYLLKTTAATDAAISAANTQWIAIPGIIYGSNFRGFTASFVGLGRYFLTEGLPNLSVPMIGSDNPIAVMTNPFRSEILLSTHLKKADKGTIRLTDITGRMVYSEQLNFEAGNNIIKIPVNEKSLVKGNYILHIVCSDRVYAQKLLKE